MRVSLAFLAVVLGTATAAPAATISLTASAFVTVDGAQSAPVSISLQDDGSFRETFRFVECDGSVRLSDLVACDGSVIPQPLEVALFGSVFPFINASVSFFDAGAPTSFSLSFFLPIPAISGIADWSLEGTLGLNPFRAGNGAAAPLPGYDFFTGLIGGTPLQTAASLGSVPVAADPVLSVIQAFGPTTGTFDCDAVGGCTALGLVMGATGLGGDHRLTLSSTFDVNAATAPAPVPLPAPALLLLAGLAGLAALRRRAK